jgi:predicted  nucleic acid-binding Zn-ribbon protein
MGAGKGEGKDAELLAPFFKADREWQDLIAKEQAFEDERNLNRDRLKELSGVRGPKKRIEFLNKEKENEEMRLNDALQKWGEAVTGGTPDAWKDLPEVKKAIQEIDVLTEEAIQLNLDIDKWEARRDVDKLKKDREYMSAKIETLEEEIQARRQEIRVLKKEINSTDKEISKKGKFIGDPPAEEETQESPAEEEQTES